MAVAVTRSGIVEGHTYLIDMALHSRSIRGYLGVGDMRAQDLEDARQEGALALVEAAKYWRDDGRPFRDYAAKCILRAVSGWSKRRRRHVSIVGDDGDIMKVAEECLAVSERSALDAMIDREDMDAFLAPLSTLQREILVLRFADRADSNTIADIAGIPVQDVQPTVLAALQRLRDAGRDVRARRHGAGNGRTDYEDLTNQEFDMLVVEGLADHMHVEGTQRRRLWRCRCKCGGMKDVTANSLRSGGTRSCGCLIGKSRLKRGGVAREPTKGRRSCVICGRPHKGKGYCSKHYQQFRRGSLPEVEAS